MRTRMLLLGLLLTACQTATTPSATVTEQTQATTTTTDGSTTTTRTSTSSTTVVTRSLIWLDIGGVEFPTDPETVTDLPQIMTRYLDAPMPNPDLSLTGPDDAERWMSEWLDWMAWAGANPEQSKDSVDVGWLLTSPQGEATRTGLEEQAADGTRSLGIPFYPTAITGTFDEFFEQGQVLNLFVEVEDRVPTYTIDSSGSVIEVRELSEQAPTLRLVLRQDKEGRWLVEQIVVDN